MGLPGSGKTTLAKELAKRLNVVHWNADEVRKEINYDLGFSENDRIEQARRMGWLCDQVKKAGYPVIADFVCPTPKTRQVFNADFIIWMDTIKQSRYEDTNKIFIPPDDSEYNYRIDTMDATVWAEKLETRIRQIL